MKMKRFLRMNEPILVIPVNMALPIKAMKQCIHREPRYALCSRGPVISEKMGRVQGRPDEINDSELRTSNQRKEVQDDDTLVETENKTAIKSGLEGDDRSLPVAIEEGSNSKE